MPPACSARAARRAAPACPGRRDRPRRRPRGAGSRCARPRATIESGSVPIEKDVLTTGDVARLCRVTIRTVIKWYEQGRLEGYKLPGSRDRRFTRDAVERFVRDYGIPDVLTEAA